VVRTLSIDAFFAEIEARQEADSPAVQYLNGNRRPMVLTSDSDVLEEPGRKWSMWLERQREELGLSEEQFRAYINELARRRQAKARKAAGGSTPTTVGHKIALRALQLRHRSEMAALRRMARELIERGVAKDEAVGMLCRVDPWSPDSSFGLLSNGAQEAANGRNATPWPAPR
jgi:hypothetical protein